MNWYLEVLKKYAVCRGRARREEYWYFYLFNLIISILLGGLDYVTGIYRAEVGVGLLGSVYLLATWIPMLAVTVRRLHDTDRSGWWMLISGVPLIGFIILLIFLVKDSDPGENRFGPNPKATGVISGAGKEATEVIRHEGGDKWVILVCCLVPLAILAAVAIPQFAAYKTRAEMARVKTPVSAPVNKGIKNTSAKPVAPSAPSAAAQTQITGQQPPAAPVATPAENTYSYNPAGKPDPFRPFVDDEIAAKKKAEKKKDVSSIYPLQRAEIDKFRVVGIAGDQSRWVAVVEDAAKKYYPLLVGTRIGLNNGKVVEILPDRVIVEEYKTKKAKTIILKLHKNQNEVKP